MLSKLIRLAEKIADVADVVVRIFSPKEKKVRSINPPPIERDWDG